MLSLVLATAGCATVGPARSPTVVHARGDVLWRIVHDRCAPADLARHDPAPCALVVRREGGGGFALLKDLVGRAQFLLIPTSRVTGIEDPVLLAKGATNDFAEAWTRRDLVAARLDPVAPTPPLSVAVNSMYGRSQDQLHLHIDCLDAGVASALQRLGDFRHAPPWSRTIVLKAHRYRLRWLAAEDLAARDPLVLLATEAPGARRAMGDWTLALADAPGWGGRPGLLLLAHRADPASGDKGSAEELQDHDCRTLSP